MSFCSAQILVGLAFGSSSVAFSLGCVQTFFRSKWFSLPLFLVVPVVVCPLLESFSFSFVMPRPSHSTNNSLSVGFSTQDSLPPTATSESPVTSTASSSWSPQLAGSLIDAVVRAIGNSISAIISSIQSNASSHVSSSVPGVSASGGSTTFIFFSV